MNIRDLQYFAKIAELRSFHDTAFYFGVQQPTISYAIKRLEEHYHTELVVRNHTKRITLTPAGLRLNQHVTQILIQLNLAKKDIQSVQQHKIKIGIPPIIGTYYFPKIAGYLLQQDLLESLENTEGGSQHLLNLLKKGDLDLALLGATQPLNDANLVAFSLSDYPFKIIVSPNHPLAKQSAISFKTLSHENFVLFNEGFVHEQLFKQLCKENQIYPQVVQRTSSLAIMKQLVVNNIGISLLTQSAIDETDDLVQLDLTDQIPEFQVSLAYRRNFIPTPEEQQIIDLITKKSKA